MLVTPSVLLVRFDKTFADIADMRNIKYNVDSFTDNLVFSQFNLGNLPKENH